MTSDHTGLRFKDGDAWLARIWKVARATSAAATYFAKQRIGKATYEKSGMRLNNPTFEVIRDIIKMYANIPELIISIGTGTDHQIDGTVTSAQRRMVNEGHIEGMVRRTKSARDTGVNKVKTKLHKNYEAGHVEGLVETAGAVPGALTDTEAAHGYTYTMVSAVQRE
jgi:hypothetical protein